MLPKCSHSLDNGNRCSAPAVRNSKFCRHHDPNRPHTQPQRKRESEPLELPPLVNKAGLLSAVAIVIRAMSERRIRRKEGGTLLFGLQLAGRIMTELDETLPTNYSDELYETTPAQSAEPEHAAGPELVPLPRKVSQGFPELAEMRRKLEAEGHVFYTPTPEDEKELLPLFEKGKIQQYADLYLAKQEAWQRKHAESSKRSGDPGSSPSIAASVAVPQVGSPRTGPCSRGGDLAFETWESGTSASHR